MDELISAQLRAEEFWKQAYAYQTKGQLADAIMLYQASIETYATAEAHTYLGWTYSFLGRYEDAIVECLKAIEIDPNFGNPYNDIGVYYLETDRPHAAIKWLEDATVAPRYESPHYPWCNLGRVYEQLGSVTEAVRCYRMALQLASDYAPAKEALQSLLAKMN